MVRNFHFTGGSIIHGWIDSMKLLHDALAVYFSHQELKIQIFDIYFLNCK